MAPLLTSGLSPDTPPVAVDDPLHNRQPDAGSLKFLGPVEALENPKKLVDILHVKPDAVISDEIDELFV